jgi:hypothetical protein
MRLETARCKRRQAEDDGGFKSIDECDEPDAVVEGVILAILSTSVGVWHKTYKIRTVTNDFFDQA